MRVDQLRAIHPAVCPPHAAHVVVAVLGGGRRLFFTSAEMNFFVCVVAAFSCPPRYQNRNAPSAAMKSSVAPRMIATRRETFGVLYTRSNYVPSRTFGRSGARGRKKG